VLAVAIAAVLAAPSPWPRSASGPPTRPGRCWPRSGVRRDPLRRLWRPPGEATVRRVLARVDPETLDQVIGRWLTEQQPPSPTTRPPPPTRVAWRQAVAVDGKTLHGSGHHGNAQVHLLAAMDHTSRRVLGQTDVDHTTNEIARFQPLLQPLDLAGRVVTADALHTQPDHADWLVGVKRAAYLLVVKANQPTLHQQLKALPWCEVPVADHTRDRRHGRVEARRLQVTTVAGLDFPHATQSLRVTRRVRPLASRRWRTVTAYAVTSLTAAQASPARLADWIRGHWGIEALHHLRDTTFAEDACQVRTGTAPWAMASLRNPLPSASCTPAATTTSPSPPRCAATPVTPPGSCRCWASPADEPDTLHATEALLYRLVRPTATRRPNPPA
jgi:predicted transposase YbfD/YdcC